MLRCLWRSSSWKQKIVSSSRPNESGSRVNEDMMDLLCMSSGKQNGNVERSDERNKDTTRRGRQQQQRLSQMSENKPVVSAMVKVIVPCTSMAT